MKISISQPPTQIKRQTEVLLSKIVSPLCGLDKQIGFIHRSFRDPKIISIGADLTGVHTLFGLPDPGPGAYHIGGSGVCMDEAMIKTLGESVERYSHFMVNFSDKFDCIFKSYEQIRKNFGPVIDKKYLDIFSKEQFGKMTFPFQCFNLESNIGWVKVNSIVNKGSLWIPAQMIFVGYSFSKNHCEKRLFPSVTTGTAVHSDYKQAIYNALMELIQIDATMGYWYSTLAAPKILLDERVRHIKNIIRKSSHFQTIQPEFYYLANIDLPGHVVACIFKEKDNKPCVAIGLGSDFSLNTAMYKAFLEASGVRHLSKITLFNHSNSVEKDFFDLDNNVRYYAEGKNFDLIEEKFSKSKFIVSSDLPRYDSMNTDESIKYILKRFAETKKDLFLYDLSCKEAQALGLYSLRLWSPELLSLAIPGAPPKNHPRFNEYGGFACDALHPYP